MVESSVEQELEAVGQLTSPIWPGEQWLHPHAQLTFSILSSPKSTAEGYHPQWQVFLPQSSQDNPHRHIQRLLPQAFLVFIKLTTAIHHHRWSQRKSIPLWSSLSHLLQHASLPWRRWIEKMVLKMAAAILKLWGKAKTLRGWQIKKKSVENSILSSGFCFLIHFQFLTCSNVTCPS